MLVYWKDKSENKKLGPMPSVMAPKASCPASCPLLNNGCYANSGAMNVYWDKLSKSEVGIPWLEMCDKVRALPDSTIWRYAVAGDLPGDGENVDMVALAWLVIANKGKRGFTFTHKYRWNNHNVIKFCNENGFTINLSANNLKHVDILTKLKIGPVVTILPSDSPNTVKTPEGRTVIACPAQTKDNVTCKSCGMCARKDREVVIGFLAHGSGRANGGKKVSEIARAQEN